MAALCIAVAGCTYSQNGCMVGHYCLVPFDGGSVNPSDWTPTASATGSLQVVAAKCDMLAHGTAPAGGGIFAAGSPAFVSDAMAGMALQQGLNKKGYIQDTINDCMTINGFERSH